MNLLHIDSSILGDSSVSRKLSAEVVSRITAAHPGATVTYLDLGGEDAIPHLTGAALAAAHPGASPPEPALADDLARSSAALESFLAADTVVIGLGLYNFGIPSQLKAWVDRVLVVGRTFRYGEDGAPQGLAGDKRVILVVARGGQYGPDSPYQSYEHAAAHLRVVFGFMGVTNLEVVVAEGLARGPEVRAQGIAQAETEIAALAA